MNKNIIKLALLSAVVALVLAGIFSLAWLNHADFEKAIIDQARNQLAFTAASEAQSIEEYIFNVQQELSILSEESVVVMSLTERHGEEIYTFLDDSYKDVKRLVDALYLINAEGFVIRSSPVREGIAGQDFSRMPDVARMLKARHTFISGIFKTSSGELAMSVLQPVYKGKDFAGLLRAVIFIDRINGLVSHINKGEGGYAFILDNQGTIINYPETGFIGKNISNLIDAKVFHPDLMPLTRVIGDMISGRSDTDVVPFLSAGYKPKVVPTIIAYAPIRLINYQWSIAVAMNYDVFSNLIHKNTKENAVSTGFVLLVFIILAGIYYKIHREKDKHEIAEVALNIINKQLRLDITEYKAIQAKLRGIKSGKNPAKPPKKVQG